MNQCTHLSSLGDEALVPVGGELAHKAVHSCQRGRFVFLAEEGRCRRDVDDDLALRRVVFGQVLGVQMKKVISDVEDFAES